MESPVSFIRESLGMPPVLTVETVENFYSELNQAVAKSPKILELDASALEGITTPGMQLLVACSVMLERLGGQLKIIHANPATREAFQQLGLADFFHRLAEM